MHTVEYVCATRKKFIFFFNVFRCCFLLLFPTLSPRIVIVIVAVVVVVVVVGIFVRIYTMQRHVRFGMCHNSTVGKQRQPVRHTVTVSG